MNTKRNILKLFFVRIFWWKKNHSEQWIYLYHYLDYYYVDYHASLLKHLVRNKTFNKFVHFIAFPAIVTTTKYNMHCHVRLNSEKFIKIFFFLILVEIKFYAQSVELKRHHVLIKMAPCEDYMMIIYFSIVWGDAVGIWRVNYHIKLCEKLKWTFFVVR